ncbi:siderophore-interacting protein [Acaricomes phytoseiuli]|uniref:siderophore-interacting protein n=1 Tax=Acaricomes phytoseiuli TaxID=291968 RepID=UPI000361F020|nr:siderophore-interacting protein [Acaricomes phytoseiuli]MCW1250484.1 siderophore-interacting protein [Acaricomes phytoseiuli]
MTMSQSTVVQRLRAFNTEVTKVQDLSPHFRRITFVSDDLRLMGADVQGRTLDLRVKVMVPSAGNLQPDLNAMMREYPEDWYRRWLQMGPEARGYMRTYTVRERRLDAGEVDIDFVLHPPVAGQAPGPAYGWARQAEVGDPMVLLGPNLDAGPCGGIEFRPGGARRLLLVGDETAVPAIGSILESLGPDVCGQVVLEVPQAGDITGLAVPPGLELTWLVRNGHQHGEQLIAEVRRLCGLGALLCPAGYPGVAQCEEFEEVDIDKEILWDTAEGQMGAAGGRYAWIAGEAGMVKELRRYLVREVGMGRKDIAFMGYWRLGRAESA